MDITNNTMNKSALLYMCCLHFFLRNSVKQYFLYSSISLHPFLSLKNKDVMRLHIFVKRISPPIIMRILREIAEDSDAIFLHISVVSYLFTRHLTILTFVFRQMLLLTLSIHYLLNRVLL